MHREKDGKEREEWVASRMHICVVLSAFVGQCIILIYIGNGSQLLPYPQQEYSAHHYSAGLTEECLHRIIRLWPKWVIWGSFHFRTFGLTQNTLGQKA